MRVSHNSENRTLSLRTASAVVQLLDWLPPLPNPEEQYNMLGNCIFFSKQDNLGLFIDNPGNICLATVFFFSKLSQKYLFLPLMIACDSFTDVCLVVKICRIVVELSLPRESQLVSNP